MAARVNTKLVVIVLTGIVVTTGVVGFVAASSWRADPMRFVRAGDAAMAAGNYRQAATAYGRAIGKKQNNLEFHGKYADAVSKVIPESSEEARQQYLLYVGSLLKRAQIARDNPEFWRTVLAERRLQSELNDSVLGWKALNELVAKEMVPLLPPESPLQQTAKAYMGYAQARQAEGLAGAELVQAAQDLEAAIAATTGPDRDLAYGGLLEIQFKNAERLALGGQQAQAAEAWKLFDATLAQARADEPQGVQPARWAVLRNRTKGAAADAAAAAAASDQLTALALATNDGVTVLEASKALGNSGLADGMARAAVLLEAYLAKNPDALVHRRALGYCLQFSDLAKAEAEAQKVVDAATLPVSLASASQDEIRVGAAQQLFDISFAQLGRATTEAETKQGIERLERRLTAITEMSKGLGDDSVRIKAEGKLAFAKGDFAIAESRFKEVFRKGSLVDAELYVLSAASAEQLGETGLALERVGKGLLLAPGNVDLLERKGSLELRNGMYQDAIRTLTEAAQRDPTRERVQQMLAAAQQGAGAGQPIDPNNPTMKVIRAADERYAAKDFDGAMKLIEPLLAKSPDDAQILFVAAQIENSRGNHDKAIELVERGLLANPGNATLTRLKVFLTSDSPVSRVLAAVDELFPAEPDRTVWKYIRLANLADATEAEINRGATKDPAELERQRALLPPIRTAVEEWKAKAYQAAPTHPMLLDFRFVAATNAKDWATAEQVIEETRRSNRDPSLVPLMQARLALAQGKPGEAATTIQRAIDGNVESADMYRLLAFCQEQMGDTVSAVRNYAEAYRRKPTDMNNAKTYSAALIKAGDRGQALIVLREARRVAGDDVQIGEAWIDLESEIGDRRLARGMRDSRYQLVPTDRQNALKLAAMLADLQPEREDILDSAQRPRYSDPQWRALDEATRQRELTSARERWRKQSDTIFNDLLAADPTNVELALVRASTLRRQGQLPQAEATLVKLITDAKDKATSQMYIALGVNYAEVGDLPKALAAFDEAVKRQDDSKREADAAAGEYWFQRQQWERAIGHLARVAERVDERALRLRLAEGYGRLRQFDKARAELAKVTKGAQSDAVVDQLESSLAEGRGDDLRASKQTEEAMKAYEEAITILRRAEQAAPGNPVVAVQQAAVLKKLYDLSGDRTKLDAAIAAAERGTKLRADYWPAAQARAELLLAGGDINASINELEKFVKATPSSSDGRRRLIQMLLSVDKSARAGEVARDAISLSPNDPQWRAALAEVELRANRIDQAILAYEQADALRRDTGILHRVTDLRLRKTPPDYRGVLAALRDRPDEVKSSPYLQSAIGTALANSGDEKRGLDAMRESFRFAKRAVAEGQVEPSVIDSWYTNLRLIYPPARTAEAERFVTEIVDGKLDAVDLRWLAESYLLSGPDGASRAIELANRSLEADPKMADAPKARLFDLVGSAKYVTGDCKGALGSYRKALEVLPEEPAILNNFAYLAAECADDPKEGLPFAERAVRLAPTRADYLDTLGFLQYRIGDRKAASDTLLASLRISPSASSNYHLALIMADEGRKQEAATYLKAASDLKPDPTLQKQINALLEKLR